MAGMIISRDLQFESYFLFLRTSISSYYHITTMRRISTLFVLLTGLIAVACHKDEVPQTDRARKLIKELLEKLDNAEVYAARKEREIDSVKAKLPGNTEEERIEIYSDLAKRYSKYNVDSSLVYTDKACELADAIGNDSLGYMARFQRVDLLSGAGFSTEARETLETIPREAMTGDLLNAYYYSWTEHYHNLYSSSSEPERYKKKYRNLYNIYRDSLLAVSDSTSQTYLHNMERKEARAGHFDEARRYNAIRMSMIEDHRSRDYARCLYDRYMIAYYYEGKTKPTDIEDLLQSAILEVEDCNYDIASLFRVESLLYDMNELNSAKKVSDFYYSSLRSLGSRQRLLDGEEQAIRINDRNARMLQKKNKDILLALILVALLVVALLVTSLIINNARVRITRLKDNLQRSGRLSKEYVGVVFQLYSSYIKRLDVFRTKIHSSLKKGQVEQVIELTSPLSDFASEERKELFHNFDSAFVDIFPNFVDTVNSCLKAEEKIVPKKTEILNNELRILALIKLGIEDSTEIADLLHSSVKTVYNLRSIIKARLAIPEEKFNKIISEL